MVRNRSVFCATAGSLCGLDFQFSTRSLDLNPGGPAGRLLMIPQDEQREI